MNPVPGEIERYARGLGPEADAVLEEMDDHADEADFPTVGPGVGGWLQLLAGAVDADRVFEFGSALATRRTGSPAGSTTTARSS